MNSSWYYLFYRFSVQAENESSLLLLCFENFLDDYESSVFVAPKSNCTALVSRPISTLFTSARLGERPLLVVLVGFFKMLFDIFYFLANGFVFSVLINQKL